jgi:hypothetical protein
LAKTLTATFTTLNIVAYEGMNGYHYRAVFTNPYGTATTTDGFCTYKVMTAERTRPALQTLLPASSGSERSGQRRTSRSAPGHPSCGCGLTARVPVIRHPRRMALIARRVAALPPSQGLTGPPSGGEPRALKGRRWGTDEFLGRGTAAPQSPWPSGQGGRPLDECLAQPRADALVSKSPAAVSEAVNSDPVITPRKKTSSSPSAVRPLDRRGHMSVRRVWADSYSFFFS